MKKILLILMLVCLASTALGAAGDYSTYLRFQHADYDSCHWTRYVIGAGAEVFVDSGGLNGDGTDSTLLTYNIDSAYYFVLAYFPTGNATPIKHVSPVERWVNEPLYAGNTVTLWTIDTTSPAPNFDTIGVIKVVAKDSASGRVYSTATTNASTGTATMSLGDGTYIFEGGAGAAYDFLAEYVTLTSDTTVEMRGEAYVTPTPSTGKTCTVSIIVKDNDGTALKGVLVTAYLERSFIVDSSGAIVRNLTKKARTNSSGIAEIECIWSGYLLPATKWRFSAPTVGIVNRAVTVPSQTTWTLDLLN